MLAEHFLRMYADKYSKPDAVFARSAYDQMLNYTWRGNVRELQHSIERAVLLSKSGNIERLDIPSAAGVAISAAAGNGTGTSSVDSAQAATSQVETVAPTPIRTIENFDIPVIGEGEEMFNSIGKLIVDRLPEPGDAGDQKDVFDGLESGVVLAALKRTNGNKQAAANLLGLYRPRLYGMIKRHKLEDQI
jgi:DNA-binding NtrC family response regulator